MTVFVLQPLLLRAQVVKHRHAWTMPRNWSGLSPDDPTGGLVRGHDPPPGRPLRPAGPRGLASRPARLDDGRPGGQWLTGFEELQLRPPHLERLRHPHPVVDVGGHGDLIARLEPA